MSKTSQTRILSRSLVAVQVVTAAAFVLSARLTFAHGIALGVATCGVLFGAWAVIAIGPQRVSVMPELKSDAELRTTGPYGLVRHPMYFALLLFTGGLAFSPFAIWKVSLWFVLLAVLIAKAIIEEGHLRERFPNYDEYARRTRRLVPFLW